MYLWLIYIEPIRFPGALYNISLLCYQQNKDNDDPTPHGKD